MDRETKNFTTDVLMKFIGEDYGKQLTHLIVTHLMVRRSGCVESNMYMLYRMELFRFCKLLRKIFTPHTGMTRQLVFDMHKSFETQLYEDLNYDVIFKPILILIEDVLGKLGSFQTDEAVRRFTNTYREIRDATIDSNSYKKFTKMDDSVLKRVVLDEIPTIQNKVNIKVVTKTLEAIQEGNKTIVFERPPSPTSAQEVPYMMPFEEEPPQNLNEMDVEVIDKKMEEDVINLLDVD